MRTATSVSPDIASALELACYAAGHEAGAQGEAENLAHILSAAILHALQGGDVSTDGALPAPVILRGLTATRTRFLEAATAAHWWDDASAVLEILAAMECVASVAARRVQHDLDDWSRDELIALLLEVVHDIRSPLGSIVFLAERLRDGRSGAVNDLQLRQLGLIYGAGLGLGVLASDLMDFVKGGRGLLSDKRPFSVMHAVTTVEAMIRPMAEEKELTFVVCGATLDARIGYPEALQRVLLNLLTNAVKFTPTGTVTLTVEPRVDGRIEFIVTDSGRGIPDRVRAVLFEPFRWREDAGRFVFSSAGLGLRICRQLVRGMGGELELAPDDSRGATWRFELVMPASQG